MKFDKFVKSKKLKLAGLGLAALLALPSCEQSDSERFPDPGYPHHYYVVQEGDTLQRVAGIYKVPIMNIVEANLKHFETESTIHPDQILLIQDINPRNPPRKNIPQVHVQSEHVYSESQRGDEARGNTEVNNQEVEKQSFRNYPRKPAQKPAPRAAPKAPQKPNYIENQALSVIDSCIDNPNALLKKYPVPYVNNIHFSPDAKRFARGLAEKLANEDGETELFAMFSTPKKQESKPIVHLGSVDIDYIGRVKIFVFGDLAREYGNGNKGNINLDLNAIARGFSWNYNAGLVGRAREMYEKRDKLKRVYITQVDKAFLARHQDSVDYVGSASVLGDKFNLSADFVSAGIR